MIWSLFLFDESNIPFNPQSISSNFNQVFFVIRKVAIKPTKYKIAVANRQAVAPHPPKISTSQVYEKGPQFRDFLLTKMINAERASNLTPFFAPVQVLNRKNMLVEMKNKFYQDVN